MPKEWIDVADTAVKIGLGSLITGVFTYIGVKFSHKSEKGKFMLEHKTKLLEQIAEDVETYFAAWDSYISRISGIARSRKNNEKEYEELSKAQKSSVKEKDSNLIESWPRRESAISKLRLMKSVKASKALSSCKGLEKEMRDMIVFDKVMPTYEEADKYRKRVIDKKKEVHKELADFYESFET
ncbi:hypothetical protein CXF80_17025 [Shewanella sp. Actino-trap-3]|uniref:hypothetical protein n=1 Tax=Shewanella sp. Actino-trap-3 TaxID=2058331 RepID=UPI000C321371|nr:hypothetical protein [Shewanella sp. Actino-trap-3]PKG79872.1 hypothetical protein CXF80_17025 [Shewanella sp. Actino-trap-3]